MKYLIPENNKLRVAISGKSGCGNTTVSKLLADTLNVNMINFTFRTLAEEVGLSLAEIIEKANLKQTSLYRLARKLDLSPEKFIEHFIRYERMVKAGE